MERSPLTISVIRLVGTLSERPSAAALMPRASSLSSEVLPRMNGRYWHAMRFHRTPLVIVDNFHVCRARRTCGPRKANSPLIVDPNAVLAPRSPRKTSNRLPEEQRGLGDPRRLPNGPVSGVQMSRFQRRL